jgi:hypothetical protein
MHGDANRAVPAPVPAHQQGPGFTFYIRPLETEVKPVRPDNQGNRITSNYFNMLLIFIMHGGTIVDAALISAPSSTKKE